MLPQMSLTSSLAFVVVLLLCFSFSVIPQAENYPIAIAPASWTNSPSLTKNLTSNGDETVCPLLHRLNTTGGMSFATGFYCFPPCKSFFLPIYIIYAHVDDYAEYYESTQVIWSANRARPVSENATFQLISHDGLTLRDSDGSIVWSTSGLNRSVAGINVTEAGNLVLFDINNSSIWQCFDHPTDCLLMRQRLAEGMNITANSSSNDLAESQFYLTLRAYGLYGYFHSDTTLEYYNIVHTTSNGTIMFMDGNLTMFSTLSNTDNALPIFTFPPAKSIQYMRLESDGHLRLYDYYYDEFQWKMVVDLLNPDNCDYPTVCGHYGICNNGQCSCPGNYFKPVDNWRLELGCYAIIT